MGTDINNLYNKCYYIILSENIRIQLEHRESERLTEFGSLLKWVRLGELGTVEILEKPHF